MKQLIIIKLLVLLIKKREKKLSRPSGLNRQPMVYDTIALPVELGRQILLIGLERVSGIEPPTIAWEANVLPLYYTRVNFS
jgi:hypothetical protein